jgi:putative hydrolase of the HAD superfamily
LKPRTGLERRAAGNTACSGVKRPPIWLFDLDDTLHDATRASMGELHVAMGDYMVQHLGVSAEQSTDLRRRYWLRYGATLLGLMRHHGVAAPHFLHHTHLLPGLEDRVRGHRPDLVALARLPGKKIILTNAPRAYAMRVMGCLRGSHGLGLGHHFDALLSIEDMQLFGHLRPKPDTRLFKRLAAQLRVHPSRCVLVEDTLQHQKAARSVGMHTVWMQRWLPPPGTLGSSRKPTRHRRKPAYVGRRVRALQTLLRGG